MLRNITWALKGNIFYAASQWALLVILAKLGGPELVGRYTLGLAVTAPIVLFTSLQLRSLLASDVLEDHKFSDYVRLRIVTSAIALLLLCWIILTFSYTAAQAVVISLIGLAKILEGGSDILYGMMQKKERMDLIGISKMVRGAATVLVFGSTLYCTGSLVASLVSMVLVWFLVLVLIDYQKSLRAVTGSFGWMSEVISWRELSRVKLLALFWYALPLGVVSMLISYNNAVPRYLLESYHSEKTLGYFSAIAYFSVAITIVVEALGQTALPRLAKFYDAEPLQYMRLLWKLSAAALVIGALGASISILMGRELLGLFYNPEFAQHNDILVLVMVLGTLEAICSVMGIGLTAARVLRFQVPIVMTALATTTLAGWRLIPEYGMQGTAWAAILGMSVWVVAYALVMTCGSLRFPRESITA